MGTAWARLTLRVPLTLRHGLFEKLCRDLDRADAPLGGARQLRQTDQLLRRPSLSAPSGDAPRWHPLARPGVAPRWARGAPGGRRDAATLTDAEHAELIRLVNEVEIWNARRLEAVAELARLRGVRFPDLVRQLGLGPRTRA